MCTKATYLKIYEKGFKRSPLPLRFMMEIIVIKVIENGW